MSDKKELSIQIVADILNVSKKSIESRIKKGEIIVNKNNKVELSKLNHYPIFQFLKSRKKPKNIKPKKNIQLLNSLPVAEG